MVVIVRVNVSCISSFDGKNSGFQNVILSSHSTIVRLALESIIHLLVAGSSLSEYVHVVHVAEFQ